MQGNGNIFCQLLEPMREGDGKLAVLFLIHFYNRSRSVALFLAIRGQIL